MEFEEIKRIIEGETNTKPPTEINFNNGICKETCNCIEIAELKNGGDMVKNYPCLGGVSEEDDLLKLKLK